MKISDSPWVSKGDFLLFNIKIVLNGSKSLSVDCILYIMKMKFL